MSLPFAMVRGEWGLLIEFLEHQPPVSSEDVATAEQRLAPIGHRIPPSYKALRAVQDGGRPLRDRFSFEQNNRAQDDIVQQFLGLGPPRVKPKPRRLRRLFRGR